MKVIKLTRGYIALVDDDDYERLNRFNWHVHLHDGCVYARRNIPLGPHKQSSLSMHREILGLTDPSIWIDHREQYKWGVDNRKENLRICTPSQNSANRRQRNDNTSGLKGVTWYPRYGKWRANAIVDGKWKHLGYFSTREDAAASQIKASLETFGEFARAS